MTPLIVADDELLSVRAPFARRFALSRLGINHERLAPGRRTSYPHAESSEDEFVYVIDGTPDVWLDGNLYRLQPGDAVGFPAGNRAVPHIHQQHFKPMCVFWW
jgi:uncharacterized cupin superfamily protein